MPSKGARHDRPGRSPGSSPPPTWAGRGGRRTARRACRCPCRRRWSQPSPGRPRAGSGTGSSPTSTCPSRWRATTRRPAGPDVTGSPRRHGWRTGWPTSSSSAASSTRPRATPSAAAQRLLSTIVRLERERGQRYGAGHLIDILLGKTTPRVAQLGHGTLSVFGVGADLSDGEWRGVVRQLLAQGLIGVDTDGFGTLRATETSDAVLSGTRPVPLRRAPARPARAAATGRRAGASAAAADLDDTQTETFERLRGWRAATAKEQGVPAYVVFHDATLRELVLRLPTTLAELATVSGIGAAKVDRYGARVLEALTA